MVIKLKLIGTTVTNNCQLDKMHNENNCSLEPEFHFAHLRVNQNLNTIYNCHFSGLQVWNLFSQGARTLEGTYNRSVKIMAKLP